MCYEYEWFHELQRAEQERREREKTDKAGKKPETPPKPVTEAPGPGKREPVPA
jgi:hypothetical protein